MNSKLGFDDDFLQSIMGDFLDESDELLIQLNENLLQLDEWVNALDDDESARCDEALLNDMFRAAHSLKGLSAMFGLEDISSLTHEVENVFDAARNGQLEIRRDAVELIFQASDRVAGMINRLKDPSVEEVDCKSVLDGIQQLLQSSGVKREQMSKEEFERSLQDMKDAQEVKEQGGTLSENSADIEDETDTLVDTATVKRSTAQADDAAPESTKPAKLSSPQKAGKNSQRKTASGVADNKSTETLRVEIGRLDELMNLAGQLVINKARFAQIGEGLKGLTASKQAPNSLANVMGLLDQLDRDIDIAQGKPNPQRELESIRSRSRRIRIDLGCVQSDVQKFHNAHNIFKNLSEAVHQLERVSDGIQKTVMDTRMVPIGPLFGRFKRVIRDITRSNAKGMRLVIRGENTELDKRMIDELADPLVHIVRNSADHGIEPPEIREAAGKPREGTVTLDAFHRGNSIVIQVIDDGKGLDADKIRDKAVEKGIISVSDANKLTPHQVQQLIWEPGLSTAEKVTAVSGRGMGMDIVRTKIEQLSGTVELDSKLGKGTTITIKLPLTLAILPSLLAEIESDIFAMPVESVVEIVHVRQQDFSTVHGLPTASVRGRVVSVVDLSQLFAWRQPPKGGTITPVSDKSLVIIGASGREVGLIVDRLLGEQDIVIKSLAENFRNVGGIAGASILGDGRVSLILDVPSIIEMAASLVQKTAAEPTHLTLWSMSMNPISTKKDISSLSLIFGLATDNAAKAITRWTNGEISLALDDVCEVSFEEAIPRLGIDDEPAIMIVLGIEGNLSGDIVLIFDERDGRELCSELTGQQPVFESPLTELEKSALMETGNILGSAYLNELSHYIGQQLAPSPPCFVRDFGSSVLEQVLMRHAMTSDTVFLSRTTFRRRDGSVLKGNLFVIPMTNLKEAMQTALNG